MAEEIARAFAAYPSEAGTRLQELRALIFEVAAETPEVGRIEERLKWGQPAYLTSQTKSGTTLRLGVTRTKVPALFVHCQTSVIRDARAVFRTELAFEGNRAVLLPGTGTLPEVPLRQIIQTGLTYHFRPKAKSDR